MKIIKNQTVEKIEGNTKYIRCVVIPEKEKMSSLCEKSTFEHCSFRCQIIDDIFYENCAFINCHFIELSLTRNSSKYEKCFFFQIEVERLNWLENFTNCRIQKIITTKTSDDDLKYLNHVEGVISLKLQFDENDIFYLRAKFDGIDVNVDRDYHNVTHDVLEFRYKPQEFSGSGLKYLQKFKKFQELFLVKTCIEKESIPYIASLTNLRKLSLGALKDKTNLCRLKDLSNLIYLDLDNIYQRREYKLQDEEVSIIAALQNLEYLNLGKVDASLEAIGNLLHLKNLKYLGIELEKFENGFEYLSKNIEHLKIATRRNIALECIRTFANLKTFHLECEGSCTINYDHIEYLQNLKKLRLKSDNLETDSLSSIYRMKNLTHLDLSDMNLQDSSIDFSKLTNLTHLDLSNTNISDKDLESIGAVKLLTHLNLSGTKISGEGLQCLTSLPNLTHLDLSDTYRLTNVEVLADISSITHLNLLSFNIPENYLEYITKLPIKYLVSEMKQKDIHLLQQFSSLEYLTAAPYQSFALKSQLSCCIVKEVGEIEDYGSIFKWPTFTFET